VRRAVAAQLAQFRQEIRDRADLAKDVENIRPNDNAAKQQTYRYRNMQSAGEARDDDKHDHTHRELREHRHGEEVIPDEADRVGQHVPTAPPLQRARRCSEFG